MDRQYKKKFGLVWFSLIGTVRVWFGLTKFVLVEFEVLNVCMRTVDIKEKTQKITNKVLYRVAVAAQL